MKDLIADLAAAEGEAVRKSGACGVCQILDSMPDGEVKSAVRSALAGTIGRNTLASILTHHGYTTSWRQISKHRLGGHP